MTITSTSKRKTAKASFTPTAPDDATVCVLKALESISTVVRLRRGDRLELAADRGKVVYVVRSGSLILQSDLTHGHRVAISLCATGCILKTSEMPPLRSLAVVATTPCQILRTGEVAFERLIAQSCEVRSYWTREVATQGASDKAHIVLLAGYSGEQRVASFFVEIAHRLGRHTGATVCVDLAYSRSDIAHYLALNPDTLSRIVSRFKALGFVRLSGRRNLEILDLGGLAALAPGKCALIEGTSSLTSRGVSVA